MHDVSAFSVSTTKFAMCLIKYDGQLSRKHEERLAEIINQRKKAKKLTFEEFKKRYGDEFKNNNINCTEKEYDTVLKLSTVESMEKMMK